MKYGFLFHLRCGITFAAAAAAAAAAVIKHIKGSHIHRYVSTHS